MSDTTLRRGTVSDTAFLLRVYASTRADELALTDWSDEQKEAFVRMQFEAQHAYYQEHYADASFEVIEVGGIPAGRLYVHRRPAEIRLVDVTLLPEFRGGGAGTALLRGLMAEAESAGKPLTIHVERYNPALRLYERLGFVASTADRGPYLFLEWRPPALR